jgi:universal stress protein A
MREYKKILACLDLTDGSEKIVERARDVASRYGAQVVLLHVVEYVPVEPMGEALLPAVQIEGELVERATKRIAELAQRCGLGQAERIVRAGNIKSEVVRVAQESAIDLIVLGSRERHGVSILFNQTEDTVLHAAPCDVLAVRWNRQ